MTCRTYLSCLCSNLTYMPMHNGKRPGDVLMINVNNYIIINFFNCMVHCIHKKTQKMYNKSFIVSKPEKQNKETNTATKQIKINKPNIGWSVGNVYLCLKVYTFCFCTITEFVENYACLSNTRRSILKLKIKCIKLTSLAKGPICLFSSLRSSSSR